MWNTQIAQEKKSLLRVDRTRNKQCDFRNYFIVKFIISQCSAVFTFATIYWTIFSFRLHIACESRILSDLFSLNTNVTANHITFAILSLCFAIFFHWFCSYVFETFNWEKMRISALFRSTNNSLLRFHRFCVSLWFHYFEFEFLLVGISFWHRLCVCLTIKCIAKM